MTGSLELADFCGFQTSIRVQGRVAGMDKEIPATLSFDGKQCPKIEHTRKYYWYREKIFSSKIRNDSGLISISKSD